MRDLRRTNLIALAALALATTQHCSPYVLRNVTDAWGWSWGGEILTTGRAFNPPSMGKQRLKRSRTGLHKGHPALKRYRRMAS